MIKLFSYNEKSCLNNELVRVSNCIILGIILIVGVSNATTLQMSFGLCILISILIPIVCAIVIHKGLSNTHFFEWDYTERKKKTQFTIKYIFVCVFLCTLFSFSIAIAYLLLPNLNMSIIGILLIISPIVFLGLNVCNIVSLYYPLFEEDLTIAYKIQKKPTSWQDSGREIMNEDVEDIIHRDWDYKQKFNYK